MSRPTRGGTAWQGTLQPARNTGSFRRMGVAASRTRCGAQVRWIGADRQVVHTHGGEQLRDIGAFSFCRELHGLLKQRGAALEERLIQPGRGGVGEVGDFLMLQYINRWEPAVEHWVRVRTIHPERLFDDLLKMAGELATFTREQRRPAPLPAYDHDDLRSCFPPLMLELRRGLSSVLERPLLFNWGCGTN